MARSRQITDKLLDFWVENEYNVLFEGRHGVGKTAMIKECFERKGLKWKYYSAATMDPWCDFVGIPRVVGEGADRSLEYILPKDLNDDVVEALFFDEFNRSHKKIRNAVMELIQFKSINGRKFKNLKIVWAAINPHDEDEDEYDVEKLDAALQDRFHVYVQVPFEPSITFFRNSFGEGGRFAVNWWKSLPENIRVKVSPRRLDYAMQIFNKKGDVSYALPNEVNIIQFEDAVRNGDIDTVIKELIKNDDSDEITLWLTNPNNVSRFMDYTRTPSAFSDTVYDKFLPHMTKMDLSALITKNRRVLTFVLNNEFKFSSAFTPILDSIVAASNQKKIVAAIKKHRAKMAVSGKATYDLSTMDDVAYVDLFKKQMRDAQKSYSDWRSTTPVRFEKLAIIVTIAEQKPKVAFGDKGLRDMFTRSFKDYCGRTNYSTFLGTVSGPMRERRAVFLKIIKMINENYPVPEKAGLDFHDALSKIGKEYRVVA